MKKAKPVLSDLPDDVREMIEPHVAVDDPETLDSIGVTIAQKRDEAKAARTSSGIEQTWKEAEEAYIGIDDANRHEFADAKWAKPMSMDGPVTTSRTAKQPDHKSTAYVRLTSRYVDAGAAKLGEILLPADDKAFSFSEMPVPELIKAKEDTSQVVHSDLGVPLTRPANPGEAVPGAAALPSAVPPAPVAAPVAGGAVPAAAGAPGAPPMPVGGPGVPAGPVAPPQVPLTVQDFAFEAIEIARKKAKAAETRIYDWLVACQYQAEMRKVIFDAARIGVGVLKAPVPESKRVMAVEKKGEGIEVIIREKVSPTACWVDPWNIFPDATCGENIHNGDSIFERDYMSARQVRDLKKLPGYIEKQIDKVIEEGPDKSSKDGEFGASGSQNAAKQKGRYEIWYFYGSLKREEIEAIWTAAKKDTSGLDPKHKEVYAIVTLINDSVVRATINPLDSGSFPYHSVPWQRRSGHWAGIGVGEQLTMPQKTVNAATRAMLNNAGKSAGSQIVLDHGGIRPADNDWTLTPDKIWFKTADATGTDVRQSFTIYDIPNRTDELMKIVEYAMQLAEESTSIPLITQGQSGTTTPETFGAANLQNNNANQLLRSIGYSFDDHITESVVRQFYEWLLLDPEIPDEEKGEFTINAHGSIALVERAIQDQTIAQMGNLTLNPAFKVDPAKWMKLFLKSKRLDPADVQYTEEEQEKIDSQPPPEAPAVTVAKIAANTAATELAAKQTTEQQSIQSEERIAQAAQVLEGGNVQNEAMRVQAEERRTLADTTVRLHQLQMEHDRSLLDYANRHQISLTQAKAELAKTAMTLQAQKELNAADNAADERKHERQQQKPRRGAPPPVQLPGRAGDGRGFEQGPAS